MDSTQHARGDIEDAMRRLLEAVAATRRLDASAQRETAGNGAVLATRLDGAQSLRAGAPRVRP